MNEDLIERAAKAIGDASEDGNWLQLDEVQREWCRRDARAAFAVFSEHPLLATVDMGASVTLEVEAAQKPTDDEREALARVIFLQQYPDSAGAWDAPGDLGKTLWYQRAEAILAAGLKLRHADGTPKSNDEIRAEAAAIRAQIEPTDAAERRLRDEFEYRIRTAVAYGAMKGYREIPVQVCADWIQNEISKAMSHARAHGLIAAAETTNENRSAER